MRCFISTLPNLVILCCYRVLQLVSKLVFLRLSVLPEFDHPMSEISDLMEISDLSSLSEISDLRILSEI